MEIFNPPLYLWVKAFHIISVIAWMAGMLYLPRLFVYHCEVGVGTSESERFKLMERKLLRLIINPAMIAAWTFGLILAFTPAVDAWSQGWFHIKFTLVVLLSGYHGFLARWRRDFEHDRNVRPQRFYRIMNEVPALMMVVIVVLAVVKPF